MNQTKIAIVGEYQSSFKPHILLNLSLQWLQEESELSKINYFYT